jgi:hypothetical protein
MNPADFLAHASGQIVQAKAGHCARAPPPPPQSPGLELVALLAEAERAWANWLVLVIASRSTPDGAVIRQAVPSPHGAAHFPWKILCL